MVPVEVLRRYLDAADVSDATIEAVAAISRFQDFAAGAIIFREDQASDHLYIVTAGQVDVQYLLPSGKRQTVDTLSPGDFLVWSAVVKPYKTNAIGICRVTSQVVAINAEGLRELCEKTPGSATAWSASSPELIRRALQAARLQITDQD